ncbi:hypothetical protein [Rathayibacter iranicus]|uniref:Uncharacterized protein n=2 Tax=Rathayibacter iranicus TaxID=59737 RepID=A0AAD1AEQ0_9MICO|nr:hypothetical protein [Rathayibacter iranicus]AZZ56869.1 hypothetical protein C7V51_14055 [Rathayibacter iranicus]MWV32522.1 hypothetical protein [Rathayibacter iranicus NCPPB 2253 = VKM Ac-1602]PPI42510.1 hypothetical protein C5E09_12910 [Rathayibacter iranicus]PPI57926.1 hypothetical protein C5E08_13815 [Rathayibacter iranicus]PPI68862.1 hypothetical protein C5E01_12865 [Rathayibacter iranicus]
MGGEDVSSSFGEASAAPVVSSRLLRSAFWLFLLAGIANITFLLAAPALRRLHSINEFSRPFLPEFPAAAALALVAYGVLAFGIRARTALAFRRAALLLAGATQFVFAVSRPQPHTYPIEYLGLFLVTFFAAPAVAWVAAVSVIALPALPLGARLALVFLALLQTLGVVSAFAGWGPLFGGHDYIFDNPLWSAVMQLGASLFLARPAFTCHHFRPIERR